MSGSPKIEQVAFAGVLQVFGHVQVGVHAGLEHRDAAQLGELAGMRVVDESAGDQHVKTGVTRLAGCGHQVGARDGAKFWTDEYGGSFFERFFDRINRMDRM